MNGFSGGAFLNSLARLWRGEQQSSPPPYERMTLTLQTERLLLRPFGIEDAPRIAELMQEPELVDSMLTATYPLSKEAIINLLKRSQYVMHQNPYYSFAIVRAEDQQLMGEVTLQVSDLHQEAMLGYWIGKPFWNQGYTTEAARCMVQFGFETLKMHRISAGCFDYNIGSARVLEKCGMIREGVLRQAVFNQRLGRHFDSCVYAILRSDYFSTGDKHGAEY